MFLLTFVKMNAQEKKEVTADSVKNILGREKGWVVLDVRTPEEFAQGHVPGALNINIHDQDAYERIGELDKNARYIVYCRTRNRSNQAADYMIAHGFRTVYQMIDGIVGWNKN
jgi:rhodanese-related sulfurtransferase